MTPFRTLAAILSVLLFATACSSDSDELVAEAGALGHIHDLVVADDGELLVASKIVALGISGQSRLNFVK